MAEETQLAEPPRGRHKRQVGKTKVSKARKKAKKMPHSSDGGGNRAMKPRKIDPKMKKLYRKRARDYDSEDDEDKEDKANEMSGGSSSDEEKEIKDERRAENGFSDGEEEDGEIQPGITKLAEGCNAFRLAFRSIIKKTVPDDVMGPVLSGNKKLIAEKLAEEETERNVKSDKKDRQLVIEKGHTAKPVSIDPHEKFLISLATKGVVKLFNAVSKAQHAQKGLDPSRFKDAKVIRKRRKEAFFSELGKTSASSKAQTSKGSNDNEGPAWAPLRDNFMLTNSRLKNWDKMGEQAEKDDIGKKSEDSSSDED